jgi:putative sigma-54 modulation protein
MTEVNLSLKNIESTDRIKEYVNKKMAKFDRLLPSIQEIDVELSYIKSARNIEDRNVAQITIHAKSCILRTEERSNDILTSIDNALEKMHHQIERYKSRKQRSRRQGFDEANSALEATYPGDEIAKPAIVRRKSFTIIPMDEIEAIEQMKLLEHENFFIFFNANTNAINVLYKRRDGTYGLIEPRLG